VDLVLTGFLHFIEEVEYFGQKVLPLVRELEAAALLNHKQTEPALEAA
jgi:FMNH2-dependent dimethyl sulfone monooxygenase